MILRSLPGPFLGWLATLLYLLLMQFLINYLPDIAGRGLPLLLIIELIAYNLAYMVVLAVPMATLLATLMAFGRLAESQAYAVIKSSGVSLLQLLWPSILIGIALSVGMIYFNNQVLPEANFLAKNLWQDVRSKKPGFQLQPSVFYQDISNYSILVQAIDQEKDPAELHDVLIYDNTEGSRSGATIKAQRGWLASKGNFVEITLEDGEVHKVKVAPGRSVKERYERTRFDRYRLRLDLSEFNFERGDLREGYRSDRTTPTTEMLHIVDSLMLSVDEKKADIAQTLLSFHADSTMKDTMVEEMFAAEEEADFYEEEEIDSLAVELAARDSLALPIHRIALEEVARKDISRVYTYALNQARARQPTLADLKRTIEWETQQADRYRVEMHKKFSIAVACLIFMLIGAPLGLSVRRGGLGTVGAIAMGIFMFYWITLVQGEKMADRGFLTPWVGMWIANIIMGVIAVWLIIYVSFDLRATPPLWKRIFRRP